MATKLPCPSPCGGYVVEIIRDRVAVNCAICGPAGRFSPSGARRLAADLAGPLGRFQTTAPRAERIRLAELLRKSATALECQRMAAAASRRNARRARA